MAIESLPADQSGRVEALDALRGLAALVVLLFHYTVQFRVFVPEAQAPVIEFPHGSYGVHLFFMISGFVILGSLERRNGQGFIKSRFIRLYPLFWACVLLSFVVLFVFPLPNTAVTFPQLAVNLTMLQDYLRFPAIDGVYWSLSYELGFYFFMYGVFRLGLARYVEAAPIFWIAGATLFPFIKPYIPHPLHYLFVVNAYGHLFAAGVVIYLIRKSGWTPLRTLCLAVVPFAQYLNDGPIGAAAVAGALAAMLWAGLTAWTIPSLVGAFARLGTVSYALYLTHQMLGYRMMLWFDQAGLSPNLYILLTLVLAVGLAALLTFAIEKPAAKALKTRLANVKI